MDDDFFRQEHIRTSRICMVEHVRGFKEFGASKRVLDIGSGMGEFVETALKGGLEVVGLEVSEYAVEISQKKGIPLLRGDIFNSDLTPGAYDGIHINHVFEHLDDPKRAAYRIHELLAPGGILYVEVPYQFDSILEQAEQLMGRKYNFGPYSLHHMSFFSPQSLTSLLESVGFEILSLKTYQRCRRKGRPLTARFILMSTMLWLADKIARRGDVIAVWAKSKLEQ